MAGAEEVEAVEEEANWRSSFGMETSYEYSTDAAISGVISVLFGLRIESIKLQVVTDLYTALHLTPPVGDDAAKDRSSASPFDSASSSSSPIIDASTSGADAAGLAQSVRARAAADAYAYVQTLQRDAVSPVTFRFNSSMYSSGRMQTWDAEKVRPFAGAYYTERLVHCERRTHHRCSTKEELQLQITVGKLPQQFTMPRQLGPGGQPKPPIRPLPSRPKPTPATTTRTTTTRTIAEPEVFYFRLGFTVYPPWIVSTAQVQIVRGFRFEITAHVSQHAHDPINLSSSNSSLLSRCHNGGPFLNCGCDAASRWAPCPALVPSR
jgi:hypothetical protein